MVGNLEFVENSLKIELYKNSKKPIKGNWKPKKIIDTNKYNLGILTGKINNFFVLDIDEPKPSDILNNLSNGKEYIKNYETKFNIIDTFTIKTPNNGIHYYFNYTTTDTETNILIEKLINRSKYLNSTIDIRTNGGYILSPNSIINNNKKYEIINDTIIKDIPKQLLNELINWLLFNKDDDIKETKGTNFINKNLSLYNYDITENILIKLLDKLPKTYLNNYFEWTIILNICKGLSHQIPNIYEIFDNWSKKDISYNKNNNLLIWNNSKNYIFDVNYLIHILNISNNTDKPLKLISKYKKLDTINLNNINKIELNNKYLNYEYKFFNDNETIILLSTCGTAKTSSTAQNVKLYIENNQDIKFLSLTNLIKLSQQQIKTFTDTGLKITNYQDITEDTDITNLNIICCINSIYNKLSSIDETEYKNYIIYIDEITSFLDTLIYNDMLNKQLKQIYKMFIKMLKNCHKLILSDAHINNNVLEIVNFRNREKTILINNNIKKFEKIKATKYNDENEFLSLLDNEIKQNKYFLLGCDSKKQLKKIVLYLQELNPEKTNLFIKIDSETNIIITDANKQFKNKFVCFTPSITTGLSFDIDNKQNVFIYIKGNSISPRLSFQQTCRTRNINEVFYFSSCNYNDSLYNNVDEIENLYKNLLLTNDKINNLCLSNNDDEEIINDNLFFKLFCNAEYETDVFKTNKLKHYEDILKEQGFILQEKGENKRIKKELNKKLTDEIKNLDDEYFNKYIDTLKINGLFIDTIKYPEYEIIENRRLKYNFSSIEKIIENKQLLTNYFYYSNFTGFKMLFYTNDELKQIEASNEETNIKIKLLKTKTNKILLLREFENKTGLKPFQIDIKPNDNLNLDKLDNEFFTLIKKVFESKKNKPKTNYEIIKFYVGMIKNICGEIDIIDSKQNNFKNNDNKINRNVEYNFKIDTIIKNLSLIKPNRISKFDEKLLNCFKFKFDDIDDDDESYKFGKN